MKHCCPLISHVVTSLVLPCNSRLPEPEKRNKTTQQLNFIFLSMAFVKGNPETKNPKVGLATIKFPITAMTSSSEQTGLPHAATKTPKNIRLLKILGFFFLEAF